MITNTIADIKDSDKRNVIDYYKYWNNDAINADLDSKRFNYSVICCNLYNDFNIATIVRNANAFLAKSVVVYGRKSYDRRGTVGSHKYTRFKFIDTYQGLLDLVQNDPLIGIDNIENSKNINKFTKPNSHFYLVLGQEQYGISDDVKSLCSSFYYIPQYGSVRSLNVGTASGIAMNQVAAQFNEN